MASGTEEMITESMREFTASMQVSPGLAARVRHRHQLRRQTTLAAATALLPWWWR